MNYIGTKSGVTLQGVSGHLPKSKTGQIYASGCKCGFDLTLAIIGLPVVLFLILILAALVRADGGPAFFAHGRVGRNEQSFRCWKLRTMVANAETRLAEPSGQQSRRGP
jgi:exopolysaccharide production protein ExoY